MRKSAKPEDLSDYTVKATGDFIAPAPHAKKTSHVRRQLEAALEEKRLRIELREMEQFNYEL